MAFGKKRASAKDTKPEEPAPVSASEELRVEAQPATQALVPGRPALELPAAGQGSVDPSLALRLDESKLLTFYANFARVNGTPEEVILDFGLNSEPYGMPSGPIRINDRIVINFFTAKRLLIALHQTVERHEAVFGTVETDIQKRLAQQQR